MSTSPQSISNSEIEYKYAPIVGCGNFFLLFEINFGNTDQILVNIYDC